MQDAVLTDGYVCRPDVACAAAVHRLGDATVVVFLGLEPMVVPRMRLPTRNMQVVGSPIALIVVVCAAVFAVGHFFKWVLGHVWWLTREPRLLQVELHAAEIPENVAIRSVLRVATGQLQQVVVGDEIALTTALTNRQSREHLMPKLAT